MLFAFRQNPAPPINCRTCIRNFKAAAALNLFLFCCAPFYHFPKAHTPYIHQPLQSRQVSRPETAHDALPDFRWPAWLRRRPPGHGLDGALERGKQIWEIYVRGSGLLCLGGFKDRHTLEIRALQKTWRGWPPLVEIVLLALAPHFSPLEQVMRTKISGFILVTEKVIAATIGATLVRLNSCQWRRRTKDLSAYIYG